MRYLLFVLAYVLLDVIYVPQKEAPGSSSLEGCGCSSRTEVEVISEGLDAPAGEVPADTCSSAELHL